MRATTAPPRRQCPSLRSQRRLRSQVLPSRLPSAILRRPKRLYRREGARYVCLQAHIEAHAPPEPGPVENPEHLQVGRLIRADEPGEFAISDGALSGNMGRERT